MYFEDLGGGEMVGPIRTLAVLPEDWFLALTPCNVIHNHL